MKFNYFYLNVSSELQQTQFILCVDENMSLMLGSVGPDETLTGSDSGPRPTSSGSGSFCGFCLTRTVQGPL